MKISGMTLLALVLSAPAFAQEEPPAEVVPVEEAPAETPPDAAPAEAAPADAPSEVAATEEAPAEEGAGEPWHLYFGADYVTNTVSVSVPQTAPSADFDSKMLRLRVGKRILDAVGLEFHYGIDQSDEKAGEIKTDTYYGLFLVPTATLFETVELAFPVGFARSEFGDGSGDSLDSVAYGVDAELPLTVFGDLPDIRLTAGGMVYYQKSDARVYGANLGLRYDFDVNGFGNPFAGLGHWIGGLFGGDDEPAPAEPAQ